jgi:hypothetical protein
MIEDDLDGPSAEELIDELQQEVEILTAQLDALQAGHRGDLLAAEIRARFGIKQRLDQELARVLDLTRERDMYKRQLSHQRAGMRELAALLGVRDEHDIVVRVREIVKGPA